MSHFSFHLLFILNPFDEMHDRHCRNVWNYGRLQDLPCQG
jgi:hypothetical protein